LLPLQFDRVQTVLCLGAHSDDIEIGCGGTLLALLAARPSIAVHWVVFGAAGARGDEARRSAQQFLAGAGSSRIVVRGFRDSYFPYLGGELKEYMESVRDDVSPDLIFTHRRDDMHQDHRVVAELTGCAFRNHLVLEYEIPKYDGDLGQPNVFVPLDEQVCHRKTDLLLESFPTQRDKPWFTHDTFRAMLRLRGIECQSPTGLAEAFHSRKATLSLLRPH
jgi:LmbE family N-acetylglucosaminyl deacetylase